MGDPLAVNGRDGTSGIRAYPDEYRVMCGLTLT